MNQNATPAAHSEATAQLSAQGVAIWLDDLSRDRIKTGNLAELVATRNVVGVTTNPTIFAGALAKGDSYTLQLTEIAAVAGPELSGPALDDAVWQITTLDVRQACDVLREIFDRTDGVDGRVSIEVDPRLARSTDATVALARRLWAAVDRPNLFIKIPATVEGLPAITAAIAEGISVNATLIFSLERYTAVIDAYITGIEQAIESGREVDRIGSVASFFVSRVDGAIDPLLTAVGTPAALALRGTVAIANARLAYAQHCALLDTPRWAAIAAAGARPQRPLWASTGVKNPDYSDTRYVTELVGPGVVNTMPEATLDAVADHGVVSGDTMTPNFNDAQAILATLPALGIDLAAVTADLEAEGVEKFVGSWRDLLATVASGLRHTAS